jgi:hypothetical protein
MNERSFYMRRITFIATLLLLTPLIALAVEFKAFKYGETWLALSSDAKLMFLEGYSEGVAQGIADAHKVITKKSVLDLKVFQNTFYLHNPYFRTDEKVLIDVMTELYKDPANVYVQYDQMMWVAKRKLDGHPIETELTNARKIYRNIQK